MKNLTTIQKQAIEEIHNWDKQSLLMELEAFINTISDNEILNTIFKGYKENGWTSYTVYYTDFFEGDGIGEAKPLGSFLAKNDKEAAEIAKREFDIPTNAVETYDHQTYFTIYKDNQEAFWSVENTY